MATLHEQTAEKIWAISRILWDELPDNHPLHGVDDKLVAILQAQYGPVVEAVNWYLDKMMTTESSDIPDWTNIIELAQRCGRWHVNGDGTGTITERTTNGESQKEG